MTDLEVLGLALVAVYFWECLGWIPKGTVAFVSWWENRWRIIHPGKLAGNPRGGLFLSPPWPPLGGVVCSRQWPLSLDAQGLLAYVSSTTGPGGRPPQSGHWWVWDAVKSFDTKGKALYINQQRVLKTGSAPDARRLAKMLRLIAAQPPEKRAAALAAMRQDSLDLTALQSRWQAFQKPAATLRWLANLQFLFLFLACPVAIMNLGLKYCWAPLLAGVLLLDVLIAWRFCLAHRGLFPEDEEERFSQTLTILLSPCSAVRAGDYLSRPVLEPFHPLAVARHLASPTAFRQWAADWLRDLHYPAHPICPVDAPEAQAIEADARARWRTLSHEFLRANGLDPDELLQPPSPLDEACQQYCPRCLSQFAAGARQCPDCGGLPLAPLR